MNLVLLILLVLAVGAAAYGLFEARGRSATGWSALLLAVYWIVRDYWP